ncbi:UNVERIFIED_CONTAM: hypothetical protein FKN15_057856 [Acipenser sinensis]
MVLTPATPKDACLAPPKDACLALPKDACIAPPKDACLAPPKDACLAASPGAACCAASPGETSLFLPGDTCPGGSLLLAGDLLGLEEPALKLPARLLTASLLAAFLLPVVQREEPALVRSASQLTSSPLAAVPLPGLPRLKESAWELSAGLHFTWQSFRCQRCYGRKQPIRCWSVPPCCQQLRYWLLATLPPMNPLKSLFLARDIE